MRHPFRVLAFALSTLLIFSCSAVQPEMEPQAQATLNSNEVHPDGRITFRYRDTGATRVEVSVMSLKTPIAMTKVDGIWSATTPPLPPETYWYWFIVDGQSQMDPLSNSVVPNYAYLNNLVTVHGPTPQLWEFRQVPHGVLRHHFYKSEIQRKTPSGYVDYYVYTPPGYDSNTDLYPTLYLLHGSAQTAADWTVPGGENFILDNLIAQQKAKPMIVVMPLGYEGRDVVTKTIVSEILPQVEGTYRVAKNRDERAIAGLSLGGMESLDIAFDHSELFAWIGSFSAGDMLHSSPPLQVEHSQPEFRLLWVSCGTDDDLITPNRELIAILQKNDFAVTAMEVPGGHNWTVWHDNLIHFAQLLFQEE